MDRARSISRRAERAGISVRQQQLRDARRAGRNPRGLPAPAPAIPDPLQEVVDDLNAGDFDLLDEDQQPPPHDNNLGEANFPDLEPPAPENPPAINPLEPPVFGLPPQLQDFLGMHQAFNVRVISHRRRPRGSLHGAAGQVHGMGPERPERALRMQLGLPIEFH